MDKRLKLFLKFILISIPLVILCILAYIFPMSYMTTEYVMWDEEFENSDAPAIEADTLIIGDSRGKSSILPGSLHERTYNISIGGATPIEMYYAVRNYINKNGAPENAVVVFAPYHFCDIDNWDQTLYFNFLKPGEIAEIYAKAVTLRDPVVAKKGRPGEMISYRLRLPSKYLAQIYSAALVGNKDANREKFLSIREDLGYCEFGSADGDDGETHECYHEYFDYSPLVIYYYERLITLLTDNGVNVTVAQPPINQASSDAMHQEFMDGFTGYMESVKELHPEIDLISEVPVYPNEYFGDSIHVNRRGAERFTEELRTYLEGKDFWSGQKEEQNTK